MAGITSSILVLLVIISSFSSWTDAADDEDFFKREGRLMRKLFSDYQRDLLPRAQKNATIEVKLGMALIHINNVDEKIGSINFHAWMRLMWVDRRFKWDPNEYDGITTIRIPSDRAWKPDVTLYNSVSMSGPLLESASSMVVYSTGDVLWIPPMTIHAKCGIDMRDFPFDTQECRVKFGSWVYSGDEIDFAHYEGLKEVDMTDANDHIEWEIKESPAVYSKTQYPCCQEYYPDITYTLVMKRRTTYYSYMYIAPPLLISFLLPVIFILPSLHVSRHFLAVGIMIINCILLENVSWAFPTTDGTIPILGRYYVGVFVLSFFALVLSAIITSLAYRSRGGEQPPGFIKKLFNDYLGRLLCVSPGGYSSTPSGDEDKLEPDAQPGGGMIITEWLRLAKVLDRLFVIIFLILVLLIAFICVAR